MTKCLDWLKAIFKRKRDAQTQPPDQPIPTRQTVENSLPSIVKVNFENMPEFNVPEIKVNEVDVVIKDDGSESHEEPVSDATDAVVPIFENASTLGSVSDNLAVENSQGEDILETVPESVLECSTAAMLRKTEESVVYIETNAIAENETVELRVEADSEVQIPSKAADGLNELALDQTGFLSAESSKIPVSSTAESIQAHSVDSPMAEIESAPMLEIQETLVDIEQGTVVEQNPLLGNENSEFVDTRGESVVDSGLGTDFSLKKTIEVLSTGELHEKEGESAKGKATEQDKETETKKLVAHIENGDESVMQPNSSSDTLNFNQEETLRLIREMQLKIQQESLYSSITQAVKAGMPLLSSTASSPNSKIGQEGGMKNSESATDKKKLKNKKRALLRKKKKSLESI